MVNKLAGSTSKFPLPGTLAITALVVVLCVLVAKAMGRPNADALYQEWKSKDDMTFGCRQEPTAHERALFGEGVSRAINRIEQHQPASISLYGLMDRSMLIDHASGVPISPKGCMLGSDEPLVVGEYSAFRWYAKRGVYAVNSLKPRMPEKVPTELKWSALGKTQAVPNHPNLITVLEPTGTGLYEISVVNRTNPSRKIETNNSNAQWAYDQKTDTVWLDVSDFSTPPVIYWRTNGDRERTELLQAPPAAKQLQWHPLNEQSKKEGTVGIARVIPKTVRVVAEGNSVHYRLIQLLFEHSGNVTGMSTKMFNYPADDFWDLARWAFDDRTNLFWLELHPRHAKVTPRFIQFDARTGEKMQVIEERGVQRY